MENIFEMGTTKRHGRLLHLLAKDLIDLIFTDKINMFQESMSLVYYGDKKELDFCYLIDIKDIADIEIFSENTINKLNFVVPDFMIFNTNSYIENNLETKIAGCPDLIVEVWSESNSALDRQFKHFIYSTSPNTEHWYIEQDSNTVECWYGKLKMPDQHLSNILTTKGGIEFDLRYLVI